MYFVDTGPGTQGIADEAYLGLGQSFIPGAVELVATQQAAAAAAATKKGMMGTLFANLSPTTLLALGAAVYLLLKRR